MPLQHRAVTVAIIVALLLFAATPIPLAGAAATADPDAPASSRTGYSDQWFGQQLVQLWSYDAGSAVFSPPVTDGKTIYAGSDGGRFFAVDKATGSPIWAREVGSAIKDPAFVAGDRIYFTTLRGNVFALSASNGQTVWSVPMPERVDAGVLVIGDRVIVPCSDGIVRGLSTADGSEVWKYSVGVGLRLLSTPGAADGGAVIEADGRIIALDPAGGASLWDKPLSGEFRHWPAVLGDRVVTAGSGDAAGGITALAAGSGEQLGSYRYSGDNHWAAPAIDPADGSIYAGLEGGVFRFTADLKDHVPWVNKPEAKSGSKRYVMWQPLVLRSMVVVPGHLEIATPDALFCFSRDGQLSYLGKILLPEKLAAPPLVSDSVLCYGSVSGHLIAMAPRRVTVNGKLVDFGLKEPLVQPTGRVLVPARDVVEQAGGTIEWDPVGRIATARLGSHTVRMAIDSNTIFVDGQPQLIDEPARIVNGSTLLPIRGMAEGLGGQVIWDDPARTVVITFPGSQ